MKDFSKPRRQKKKKENKKISAKNIFLQNFLRERETIPVKFRFNSSSTYKQKNVKRQSENRVIVSCTEIGYRNLVTGFVFCSKGISKGIP